MKLKDSGLKKISNPPFKSFIDYRIGDYNTFRKVMLNLIKENGLLREASILNSDKNDYGRTLMDMWAYLCDILTYYQERTASESFLRTAGLEESVIELLYLVDYLPRRGRSASTLVRFVTNEKNIPPKESVLIPKSFKIRSIPAKGQESIIFETDESLAVSSDHDLMKLDGWRTSYKIERGTTQLALDKIYPELNIGDLVMICDDKNLDVIRISKKVDKDGKTQITWGEDKGLSREYNLSKTKIQRFTQVVRPFGYNAPPSILSNVGVTLYKKKPSDRDGGSSNATDENREPVSGRLAQLVDVSDRVVASATSDKDGMLAFKGLIPGSYRILIARSQSLTDDTQLYPIITTISTNRFQLLPGYESWFDAELEFGGGEVIESFANTLRHLSKILQESLFTAERGPAERGPNMAAGAVAAVPVPANPFLPPILETIANDLQSDMRPGLNLMPKEPYPFDPVNDDILSSEVYLDKVYGNIRQGSFVIISKDDPSNQIDTSVQLYKISRTGQIFHAKYGVGGNASMVNLGAIDAKKENKVDERFVFCWEDIFEELEKKDKTPEIEGREIKNLINFLSQDIPTLDSKTTTVKKVENDRAIQVSDQDNKNDYLIRLDEKDEGKAILFKNDKKLLEFIVRKEGGDDAEKKTNLYARKIESAFYKIRNTLIFTNPIMELGVDPRYASQDKTEEYAENITVEGMHIGLKDGMFLAINDNTSVIKGRLVDSNLKALKGYIVRVYRVQKQDPTSSVSATSTPIEVMSQDTDVEGSFSFDDLRSDSYLLSLSLPLKKYWSIFVDDIFGEVRGDKEEEEKNRIRTIIDNLMARQDMEKISHSSAKDNASTLGEEQQEEYPGLSKVLEYHLNVFLELIAIIKEKTQQGDLETRFVAYMMDILRIILEIETRINSIKDTKLPLLRASFIEASRASSSSTSSSSSSPSMPNSSSVDIVENIEQEIEPRLRQLESTTQQMLNRFPSDAQSAAISNLREFAENTIIRRLLPILKEILAIIKEALQSPFRSTIYENNEHLVGVTKTLNLESNTGTNFTMTFNIKDRLTYVESVLEYSKFQVTKIAGAPTFSKGKTHIRLDPPLKYRYVKGFAEIYGNIAPASHGETIKDELIGSGDASAIHQEFNLRKGPISYVPSPLSPNGIKSTLKVIVNDVQWQEVDDFLNSSPNDQHYITSLNEDGSIKITFGDGIRGSTLPTGVDNVHAQYRVGMGFRGNLKPNTPVVPQENNPAIKSVSIPAGSYGGSEKILSQQKRSYRPQILTLGRAVSLEDYSNLAMTFGEISKAKAYLTMKAGRETVVLVVAGQRSQKVSSPLQIELRDYMNERRDISVPLEIESFIPVPIDIVVEVKVNDTYRRSKVVFEIQTRLGAGIRYDNNFDRNNDENHYSNNTSNENQGFIRHYYNLFSFDRLNFGQNVMLSEVYAMVENVPGVDFAVVRKFCRRDIDAKTAVQEVIGANNNEILQCENDPLDPIKGTIKILARGGVEI